MTCALEFLDKLLPTALRVGVFVGCQLGGGDAGGRRCEGDGTRVGKACALPFGEAFLDQPRDACIAGLAELFALYVDLRQ